MITKYMYLRISAWMIVGLMGSQSGFAQCLDPINAYLNESAQMEEPKEGQVYFMQFKVQTVPHKNSSMSPSTVESKVMRSKERLVYETKEVSIYSDREDAFMIVHPLKRIVWGQSPKEEQQMTNMDVASAQQAIFSESELVSCEKKRVQNGHEILNLRLKSNERIQKELKIDFSIMDFDLTANRILKVESIFSKGHQLARQIIEYQALDYDYKGREIQTAKSMVFGKDGKVLPAFKNYTLIEN